MFVLAIGARSDQDGDRRDRDCRRKHDLRTPLKLVGAIFVPGNPLHFDISWVDQETERDLAHVAVARCLEKHFESCYNVATLLH